MQNDPIEIQGSPDDTPESGVSVARENLSILLIALGSVMLMIVIFRMLRRSSARQRRQPEPAEARTASAAPASRGQSPERLERLMSDAEELTRRLAAHLENKAAQLDELLGQVDARTEELRSLLDNADRVSSAASSALAPERPPEAEVSSSADPMHRKVYELADQGLDPVDIARSVDRPTGQVELILALRRA